MKGKIDKHGHLFIDRRGLLKQQDCRATTHWYRAKTGVNRGKVVPAGLPCTDYCPLFSEPVETEDGVLLSLCHGKALLFEELEDLREAGGETKTTPGLLPLAKLDPSQ